ncbi:MAG: tetratricopeptide repeat protein [Methanothrix sp.]
MYDDCICVKSNSSTPRFQISVVSIENESAKNEVIVDSKGLDSISEAKKKFLEGVEYSRLRDASDNRFEKKDNNSKAIQSYEAAKNIDPEQGEIWYNLGNAYYYNYSFQEALSAYNNAITVTYPINDDKRKSWVYFNMGNSHYQLKDFKASEDSYESALKLNLNYSDAYNNRALARIEHNNNYSGALDDLNEARSILYQTGISDRKDKNRAVRVWNNIGLVLSHLKLYDEALSALQNATDLRPENPYSYFYKGLIVAELGKQLQESLDLLDESLRLGIESLSNRDRFMVLSSKGNIYLKFQDYSNAVSAFDLALDGPHTRETSWNKTTALIGKGKALMNLKDKNIEALESFNKALEEDPNNVEANFGKGDILYELGCYEEAFKAYQDGLRFEREKNLMDLQIDLWFFRLNGQDIIKLISLAILILTLVLSIIYRTNSYKNIFPLAIFLQLFIFLFVIYQYFPLSFLYNYIFLSALILIPTIFLRFFYGYNEGGVWSKLEETSSKIFIISPLISQLKKKPPKPVGLLNLVDRWLPRLIVFSIFILLGAAPLFLEQAKIFNDYTFNISLRLLIIMALGFILIFIPLFKVIISENNGDNSIKEALLINFCWLGLNSIYLSVALWCNGLTKLNSPYELGLVTIPKETPVMPILITILFFLFLLIPYRYGWQKFKQEKEKKLTKKLEELDIISYLLKLDNMDRDSYNRIFKEMSSSLEREILDRFKNYNYYPKHLRADFILLNKKYIKELQNELDSSKASNPQIWITSISLLSPVIIQILSYLTIQMGLSSNPESLFSGLPQMLGGS